MHGKKFIVISVLSIALGIGASSADAVPPGDKGPPGVDLLDCAAIPADGACFSALTALCDATDVAPVGNVEFGFKKQNDHDTLVSKVVSAAMKYDQNKDGKGDSKIGEYGTKLNGLDCFDVDDKPKIQCTLQTDLNLLLIAAEGACPPTP